jgi:hypothetical protein
MSPLSRGAVRYGVHVPNMWEYGDPRVILRRRGATASWWIERFHGDRGPLQLTRERLRAGPPRA